MKRLFLAITLLILAGCNRPMKDPHLLDPIYHHYKDLVEMAKSDKEKNKDAIDKTNELLEKAEPQTGERKELLDQLFALKQERERLTEKIEYNSQKMRDKIKEDAVLYAKAYKENKPWPDPSADDTFRTELKLLKMRGKEWLVDRRLYELLGKKPSYMKGKKDDLDADEENKGEKSEKH